MSASPSSLSVSQKIDVYTRLGGGEPTLNTSIQLSSANDLPESQSSAPVESSSDDPSSRSAVYLGILVVVLFALAIGLSFPTLNALSDRNDNGGGGIPDVPIMEVHVVWSNHLDVGFDGIYPDIGTIANVLNKYFDDYIPLALTVNSRLNASEFYSWMTQSYVIDLYLDCPEGLLLHCPSEDQRQALIQGIRDGKIWFHAFPFNGEAEVFDSSLFSAALEHTQELCIRYNLNSEHFSCPKAMSQRDVPGTTRAIIPLLAAAGITTLSFGVNGFSSPPVVQRVFRWLDPASGTEVLTYQHPGGYGGYDRSDAVMVQGFGHALITNWRGDNAGPANDSEVRSQFELIRAAFPGAYVHSSTFDQFGNALRASGAAYDALPVFTSEMGDTWIYGIPSDYVKVQQWRAIQRGRKMCLALAAIDPAGRGACDVKGIEFKNFSRLLHKGGEHTWGGDVKTILQYQDPAYDLFYQWSNPDFEKVRSNKFYQALEATWEEQREWAVRWPVSAFVNSHAAIQLIQQQIAETVPSVPDVSQFNVSAPSSAPLVFTIGNVNIRFCNITGKILSLSWPGNGGAFINPEHPILDFVYQTYSEASYSKFLGQYGYCDPFGDCNWGFFDFGKPNCSASGPAKDSTNPATLVNLYWRIYQSVGVFVLELELPSLYITDFGAPQKVFLEVEVQDAPVVGEAPQLNVNVQWFNKTVTRLPEALWLKLSPEIDLTYNVPYVSKLGSWIDATDVFVNGSSHLHAVDDGGVKLPVTDYHTMTVQSWDASLVSLGLDSVFPTPLDVKEIDFTKGIYWSLYNNIWGTNYIMYNWIDNDAKFRFTINFQ